MNRLWDAILRALVEAAEPRCLVEIGVADGLLTAKLLDYCNAADAVLHAIDPSPQLNVTEWRERYGSRLAFHEGESLAVLGDIHGVDVVFVDGDHNWFTVYHELKQLEQTALSDGQVPPLIAVHDVGWPYGRRDMYYEPGRIPGSDRQPYQKLGLVPGENGLVEDGLNAGLNNAVIEGSPRNGVRTAIEDFVAQSGLEWLTQYIPGFHGLGIMVTTNRLGENHRLSAEVQTYCTAQFLADRAEELELERIRNEILAHRNAAAVTEHVRLLDSVRHELLDVGDALANERRTTGVLEQRAAGDQQVIVRLQSELANYQSAVEGSVTWRLLQRARRVVYGVLGGRETPLAKVLQKALRGVGRLVR